jgi:mRNA interferase MazF
MLSSKPAKYDVYLADLNPPNGTEPGKIRPVVVIQSDIFNQTGHPSTIICPLTSKIIPGTKILRIHLKKGDAGLSSDSDIIIDQIRAIDNRRLKKKIGILPEEFKQVLNTNIAIILDL